MNLSPFRSNRRVALAALVALSSSAAWAQTPTWPDKPVRLVVPYSAGGTTDYAARQIAQKLTDATGKSFFVENKTGASGTIATQEVVRSAADGNTLLVTDTTYTMLPLAFAKLPWNHRSDLVHVTGIIETPVVLVVSEKSPFKSLKDLVTYAKANPGKLNFGSGGPASSTHLAGEVFKEEAKIFLTHIPYRGAGAAMSDVMAGQIDLLITAAPTALPQIKGGRVRALATTGDKRLLALPNVPTFAEAGLPSFKVVNWFGLAAPKGTPTAVVEKLHDLVAKAMTESAMRDNMLQQGAAYRPMTVQQFGEFVNKEVTAWAEAGKRAGVKPE